MVCRCSVILTASSQLMAMIAHLEEFTAISQASDHTLMASNKVRKFWSESTKTTASSANGNPGMRLVKLSTLAALHGGILRAQKFHHQS
ncbi:hypothetical protein AYI70_g3328 [Smittium culicis]|uniref:Uncharacterized protein n=1 Tax=Smittium culicis TaxID=133412 RepID=A0A1R1Y4E3_9FUNG|nr:hypothetical protein AYI70_g3328 [Smittium culicis]